MLWSFLMRTLIINYLKLCHFSYSLCFPRASSSWHWPSFIKVGEEKAEWGASEEERWVISLSVIEVADSGRSVTWTQWEITSFISVQRLPLLGECVWCPQGLIGLFTQSGKPLSFPLWPLVFLQLKRAFSLLTQFSNFWKKMWGGKKSKNTRSSLVWENERCLRYGRE